MQRCRAIFAGSAAGPCNSGRAEAGWIRRGSVVGGRWCRWSLVGWVPAAVRQRRVHAQAREVGRGSRALTGSGWRIWITKGQVEARPQMAYNSGRVYLLVGFILDCGAGRMTGDADKRFYPGAGSDRRDRRDALNTTAGRRAARQTGLQLAAKEDGGWQPREEPDRQHNRG